MSPEINFEISAKAAKEKKNKKKNRNETSKFLFQMLPSYVMQLAGGPAHTAATD